MEYPSRWLCCHDRPFRCGMRLLIRGIFVQFVWNLPRKADCLSLNIQEICSSRSKGKKERWHNYAFHVTKATVRKRGNRMTPLATLTLGLLLGLKHAFDSDHLIAVSTIVSRERSPWRSLWIGLFWGLGHTVSLVAAGVLVLGMKIQISEPLGLSLECFVGVVLVGLGLSTLYEYWRRRLHAHIHVHEGASHTHFHGHANTTAHQHQHLARVGAKPLVLGMVHGLAGSAALMLLVLTTIPSPTLGFLYIAIFGFGSVLGMGMVSLLMGLFFSLATDKLHSFDQGIRLTVGALSTAFGVWMVVEVGFIQGLFLA